MYMYITNQFQNLLLTFQVMCDITSNVLCSRSTCTSDKVFEGMRHDETLTRFIDRVVNPDTEYLKKCGETINSVAEILRSKLFDCKVKQVIKVCIAFTVL